MKTHMTRTYANVNVTWMRKLMDKFNITTSGSGQNRDELTHDKIYVALLTIDFCKNDNCLGELRDAYAMKLPMFAIMQSGFDVPDWILKMPWRKIIMFTEDQQIPVVSALLKHYISQLPVGKSPQNA